MVSHPPTHLLSLTAVLCLKLLVRIPRAQGEYGGGAFRNMTWVHIHKRATVLWQITVQQVSALWRKCSLKAHLVTIRSLPTHLSKLLTPADSLGSSSQALTHLSIRAVFAGYTISAQDNVLSPCEYFLV